MNNISTLFSTHFSKKNFTKLLNQIFITLLFIFVGCDNSLTKSSDEDSSKLLFIASEGNFGQGNGSISVFKDGEKIQSLLDIGDVVQSILVHEDMLFVIVNGSSEIKRYTISESGLDLPGITISTQSSSPREMVVLNKKLYFTNWNTKDIKILNLNTYAIEDGISLDGLPEEIISDGSFIYTSISNLILYDQGNGSRVIKIDPSTKQIVETYEVGRGPQHMVIHDNNLWVSRTYYSEDWYQTYFGTTHINIITGEIVKKEYGSGMVCGGNVMVFDNQVYRTYEGGIAPIDENDLSIRSSSKIGDYGASNIYSAEALNKNVYFGITKDYQSPDTVYIHNDIGEFEYLYEVGASPGDYAIWQSN
jgi:hypothetical protein